MTPQQLPCQQIDRQLEQAGWNVQDFRDMNISASLGVAVRREVFTFHRPGELIRLLTLDRLLRARLRKMPPLDTQRLWRVQVDGDY